MFEQDLLLRCNCTM